MVVLNRIYTRAGDSGATALASGERRPKHDLRIDAYGTVDETNACLGLARLHTGDQPDIDAMLARIQNDLFDLGADLATPPSDSPPAHEPLRVVETQVERLEQEIDRMNEELAPLTSFILPGGSRAVAALHLARAVVRRAERAAVALNEAGPLNPHLLAYLNRLSDHLFVAARVVAQEGGGAVLWVPGATRH